MLKHVSSLALTAALSLSMAEAAFIAPPAAADSVYEKRQADMQKRKELLQQAREKALAKGGVTEGQDPAASAAAVSTAEADKVTEANAGVERGNQDREKEAARMRESLKGSVKNYDATSKQSEKTLKPGNDNPDNPSWFTNFLEQKQQQKDAPASTSPAAPELQSGPNSSFGQFLKPKENPASTQQTDESTASSNAAQKPSTTPSAAFLQPKEEKLPGAAQPPPPPPEKAPEIARPEPKSSLPAASSAATPSAPLQSLRGTEKAPSPPPKPSPAPATPQPPSAPKPTTASPAAKKKPAAKSVQSSTQKAQKKQETRRAKRKGPLPAFLVQLLLLAAFGASGYAFIFKEEETNRFLAAAAKGGSELYSKAEGAIKKQTKKA